MAILPPPDNDYRGSRLAIWFLWFQIAVNAFRGWVHVFWADSGAGRIAGIDLTNNGAPVISLLAAVGADQIAWGVIETHAANGHTWQPRAELQLLSLTVIRGGQVFDHYFRGELALKVVQQGEVAARRIDQVVSPAGAICGRTQELLEPERCFGGAIGRRRAAAARIVETTARPRRPHLHHVHDRSAGHNGLQHLTRGTAALIVAARRHDNNQSDGSFALLEVFRRLDDRVEHVTLAVGAREESVDATAQLDRVAREVDDACRPVAERIEGDVAA